MKRMILITMAILIAMSAYPVNAQIGPKTWTPTVYQSLARYSLSSRFLSAAQTVQHDNRARVDACHAPIPDPLADAFMRRYNVLYIVDYWDNPGAWNTGKIIWAWNNVWHWHNEECD